MLQQISVVITLGLITLTGTGCISSDDAINNTANTNNVSSVVVNTAAVDEFTEKEHGKKPAHSCYSPFRAILVGKAYEGTIDLSAVRDRAIAAGFYVLEHVDNDTSHPRYLLIEQGGTDFFLEISIFTNTNHDPIFLEGCSDVSLVKDQYKTLFSQIGLDSTYPDRLYFEKKRLGNSQLIE